MAGDSWEIEQVLTRMIQAVVERKEAVSVRSVRGDFATLVEVAVAPEDVGLLLGRQGNTIRAIRHLAHVMGVRNGRKIEVSVLNTSRGGSQRDR